MNAELNNGFRLKDWEIWPLRNLLSGPDGEHHIEPKAMQVLVALASQPGDVVTREALLEEVWPDTYSGEVSLTGCISRLRHCFSDERGDSEFIETIPKIGYRLVAPVEPLAHTKSHRPPKPMIWAAVVIAALALGSAYLVVDRLVLDPARHTVTVKAVIPSDKSIAVLPFVNVSDNSGNEYFCHGISEDILNLLAKVPELRVTSRTSAFSFKEQNLDIPMIAARLNVAHILEGSVRKSGSQLRITTQLIEAKTDTHLWSETYDRKLENVFAIQHEIAAAVVDALKITLLGEELKTAVTSPEAYALYLQGRYLAEQGGAESNEQARILLKQALAIDSNFAPAWADLGILYIAQASLLSGPYGPARDAIQKALALDPQYGRAYAALGDIEIHDTWDFTAADQYMQRALALNPGDAYIVSNAAHLESLLGRHEKAIDLHRQIIALDPVRHRAHRNFGYAYYWAGRLEEAADSFQLAQSLRPGRRASSGLGLVLLAQGDAPAAQVVMEQTVDYRRSWGLALVQHALGDAGASDAALQEFIDKYGHVAWVQVAEIYAFRGEIDHAFDWLKKAYDNRDPGLPFMLARPLLDSLHDDPRWEPFLDKMGLPH